LLLTDDRALAEDLVQDAFARLVERLRHLRDPGAFGAYLRRNIVNSALQFLIEGVSRPAVGRFHEPHLWGIAISIDPVT
jgi:DNA-directed RNA polymerase specialized sigma24 family protein